MIDKEKKIEILNKTINRYTDLLAKYGNVSTWKNYIKKAKKEIAILRAN